MAWFRACKEVSAFLFTIGFIIGGTLSGLLVNEWFDRVYLPAILHNLSPLTLSLNYYHGTSPAFKKHGTHVNLSPNKTIRKRKKRIKQGIGVSVKQRNSATGGNKSIQNKPKAKCNFSDTNTFKDCYVLRNDNKTWHDSGKQCKHLGMQLAVIDSPEELDFVRKFLSSKEQDIEKILDKSWKERKLDPVERFAERTFVKAFGKPKGRRRNQYYKDNWLEGIAKTWHKVFGDMTDHYELSQTYWVSNVLFAPTETPKQLVGSIEIKDKECMSVSAVGNNRTDCQHKLPFLCEYNK